MEKLLHRLLRMGSRSCNTVVKTDNLFLIVLGASVVGESPGAGDGGDVVDVLGGK